MTNTPIDQDSDETKDLKTVVLHFYNEDRATREIQIRLWKELKYYWNNMSNIWWNDQTGSYSTESGVVNNSEGDTTNQAYYDRPVNVFKAFLETIIAALSISIPAVSCIPDDADNPLDISTAKAGNIISKQIYKHNNAILLWLQALYIYCTEGLIACYTREESSEEYGTYQEAKYKKEETEAYLCPSCGIELDEELLIAAKLTRDDVINKFDPNKDDTEITNLNREEPGSEIVCPDCALAIDPNLQKSPLTVERFDGYTTKPKSRICMDVYGGLYIKVALYAKKQKDTPYLQLLYETHYVNELKNYSWLSDKLPKGAQGSTDDYESYARLSTEYRGTAPEENVTVKHSWLRPQAFYILEDKKAKEYIRKYPNGVKVVMVNDFVAEICAENLDDHWTLTQNPTSDYLTHEPLGRVLQNIQDIVNDLISLVLQTIEHGITETWVDPAVVNTNAYGQREASPGTINATKPVSSSRKVGDAFFQTSAASLSPEVFSFYGIVNQLGQFVSGALPSLFGGVQAGSGDTASEYAMSKDMALQRLNTPYKMLSIWWKSIFSKAIPQYIKVMVDDERVVEKDEQGNFINVFIRKSETAGKIGDIEFESGDQLPVSEESQRQIILELMQLNNAEVFSALVSPENLPYVRKIVRIPEFRMPGEDDRQKQYEEIVELLNTVPVPITPGPEEVFAAAVSGMPPPQPYEVPSVEVDPLIDNHQIESDICRSWAISEAGRLAKKENPEGYKNVMLHMQMHQMELQKQAAQMAANQAAMAGNETEQNTPKGQKQKGPEKIKGESNAQQPVG